MKQSSHCIAALALGGVCTPCRAFASGSWGAGPSGLLLVTLWLLALGWGFHALLRRHLRFSDRLGATQAQLGLERHARALAERALADTHGTLCKLVEQQEDVRETERRRIARDIHDDLGQNLLALKIELSMLQMSTKGAHPQLHQKLGCMIGNLDLAIKSLRGIINDLRPMALEAGLRYAMEWQLSEFSRINGIRHQFQADPDAFDPCPHGALDAMLFRVLQESLSNVARHAQATEVQVVLGRRGASLTLLVEDNGVGIAQPAPAEGAGLAGIRDRVAALGGCFAIDSRPGAGTVLSLSIPLSQGFAMH